MRHQRQLELLERYRRQGSSPLAETCTVNPASAYTSVERFERERAVLFRQRPVLVGLSAELRRPGDYVTADLGGVPAVVVRGEDGIVAAMANICRHRGSAVVCGSGHVKGRALVCPYHGWTYRLDGSLKARPRAGDGFSDCPVDDMGLARLEVAEAYGLVFARAEGKGPIDVDEILGGAEDDLASYDLARHHLFDVWVQELPFNWKLVIDTFLESYHVPFVHRETIQALYHYDRSLYETFGPNPSWIGICRSIDGEFEKPESERSLLSHATVQYALLPNAVLVHQFDHVELWRVTPVAVDRTIASTALFAPTEPVDERAQKYWGKNLEIVLNVTSVEDFPQMATIQRNLAAGVVPEVVYGRNEPALGYFHRSLNRLLDDQAVNGDA